MANKYSVNRDEICRRNGLEKPLLLNQRKGLDYKLNNGTFCCVITQFPLVKESTKINCNV